jgi:5'-3' exonuclease
VQIHLVDGTYELFRHFYALPPAQDATGQEVAATRGVLASLLSLIEEGATHIGVATDHVIESFRNDLYARYKTGAGIDPALRSQFEPLEEVLAAVGFRVWAMVEHEADDALATAAETAAADPRVERVVICTPDKDLAQCVRGTRVVQLDRRKRTFWDEAGVAERFGVGPASIPDYLALVGDSADGFPGVRGFGPRTAAALLARWGHLEAIPEDPARWQVDVRGAARLGETLTACRADALLFRRLATLVRDVPGLGKVDDWRWRGPTPAFDAVCRRLGAPGLLERTKRLASAGGARSQAKRSEDRN